MTTKQEIKNLVAGLKYNTSFEDVSNEPSYVVDEIIKIFNQFIDGADTLIVKNTRWEKDDIYPVEVVPIKPLIKYLKLWSEEINR